MSPRISGAARAGLLTALACTVPGCATLGGTIKGSFACRAPDGICAPSATIDDRALAMISGIGSTRAAASAVARASSAPMIERAAAPSTARSGERVLRIVFPAWVDDEGRLHETAAVRVVVADGHWRPAEAFATALAAPNGFTLAEAIDRADPIAGTFPAIDPQLPDPAAVAAARATSDPVAAIKEDVARRLGTGKAPSAGPVATAPPAAHPPAEVVRAGRFPAASGEDR